MSDFGGNQEICYGIIPVLPEELTGFQSREPRQLADGSWILKWRGGGEPPVDLEAAGFEQNRFQVGILYWFVERRRWYTNSEIRQILEEEPSDK